MRESSTQQVTGLDWLVLTHRQHLLLLRPLGERGHQ